MNSTILAMLQLRDYHIHHKDHKSKPELLNGIDKKSLEKLRDALKVQYEYYKSENKKSRVLLKKLNLSRENLLFANQVRLARMNMWQEILKTKNCTTEAFTLSYYNLRKKKNSMKYVLTRTRNFTALFKELFLDMSEQLRSSERYLVACKEEIADSTSISTHNISLLKIKIDSYKCELVKYTKRNPWIQNKKCSLDFFMWEIQTLNYLKNEKKILIKELERFQGLHPDLHDAAMQLQELERDLKEFWKNMMKYQ